MNKLEAKKKITWRKVWLQRELILMSIPLVLYKILFSYVPITGWSMAFQKFKPSIRSMWDQEWVGFEHFAKLLNKNDLYGEVFLQSVRNTFGQSILTLVLGYFCAIGLSLLINEVRSRGFKRIVQNIFYLPHFLSWIIATGMISTALAMPSSGGFINSALMNLHLISEPIAFLQKPEYFWGIVAGGHLWKELGWNTIIYLAAMTAIDPSLYEAAEIDGANRYQKMAHITLPCIKPTIMILLIMSTGQLLEAGFEIQYFLGGTVTASTAQTIDIFVLKYGLQLHNYSLATVAGILKTGVSIVFVFFANWLAGRLGSDKLI